MEKVQRGLPNTYQREEVLRFQVLNACRGVPECDLAGFKPADTYEKVLADLRSAIGTAMRSAGLSSRLAPATWNATNNIDDLNMQRESEPYQDEHGAWWVERRYNGNNRDRGGFNRSRPRSQNSRGGYQGSFAEVHTRTIVVDTD
ncbi:hypothetical protein K3495_g17398 [Podosphaera aphanis]|nr:hypothetical protein K3495_g17398 [Podosphaera aphanis]